MLKPLNKNVILKKEEVEKKTASGIILTDTSKEKSSIACVVAVGKASDCKLKEHDRVVYKEYAGTNITLDDVDYIIIEDENILAVID